MRFDLLLRSNVCNWAVSRAGRPLRGADQILGRIPKCLYSTKTLTAGGLGTVKDIVNISEINRKIGTWTVDENETVFEATRRMVERRIGCLCVTRNGIISGIVTERDYLTSVLHCGRRSETTLVKEIATMDDKLIVVDSEDSVQDCLDIMCSSGIRHLPILEGGEIVAFLGIKDIAKSLAKDSSATLHKLGATSDMAIHDG